MRFLLSSLLLASFCAISSRRVSSSGTLSVIQSPDVSVMEGETVSITCCWERKIERMWLTWMKNETNIKMEIFNKKNSSGCSILSFTNIRGEDSGRYTCKLSVEIPSLSELEGNGTIITVTARDNRANNTSGDGNSGNWPMTSSPPLSLIIPLAVLAPLLVVALAIFCIQRRRQAQAARVIYEVPHIDSDVPDVDKSSTSSSRESSQWCQVPVYESFDYFERVQTKESG